MSSRPVPGLGDLEGLEGKWETLSTLGRRAGYTMGAQSAQPPQMPALWNQLACEPARSRTDSRVFRGDI